MGYKTIKAQLKHRSSLVKRQAARAALGSGVTDAQILFGWQLGLDTYDIGLRLHLDEHVVANRLPGILDAERARRQSDN